jgi:hypothetical protein
MSIAAQTPLWLRIVGVLALAWNALGVWSYLGHVGLVPSMAPGPEPAMPAAVTAAYAIGVFAAIAGAIGLVAARRWAQPLFVASLLGLMIDWGWVFANAPGAAKGIGVAVLAGAVLLVLLSRFAAQKGWLR